MQHNIIGNILNIIGGFLTLPKDAIRHICGTYVKWHQLAKMVKSSPYNYSPSQAVREAVTRKF